MPGIEDRNAPVTVRAGVTVPRLARASGGGRAGAAGHRARRRLRPDVRAPVGAAAGAGARLSVAARRGADLSLAGRLAARGGRAAGAPGRSTGRSGGSRWMWRSTAACCGCGRRSTSRRARISADDYPRFRAFLQEVDAALGSPIGVSSPAAGGIMSARREGRCASLVAVAGRRRAARRPAPRGRRGRRSDEGAGRLAGAGGRAGAPTRRRLFDRRLRAAPRDPIALFGRASIDYERGASDGRDRRLRGRADRARATAPDGASGSAAAGARRGRRACSRSTTRSARPRAGGSSSGWRPRTLARAPASALARARRAGCVWPRTPRARRATPTELARVARRVRVRDGRAPISG